ncbi:unnamed protein product [Albugo candida]|uniref:Secreted protein n=1 Tax=Albugo candida TaxID=65357 RepID=A0A024FWM6_9STRA|nr:unnamed protein product [Albugo candida]|eukprot:CCI11495.1 unnamed protein product [Albugo candida]
MMLRTALCVPFLTVFVSTSGYRKANFVATSSGILNVTAGNTRDFAACHRCLVLCIGIERIDLIEASKAYRLYWVDVHHSGIIITVISHCIAIQKCVISARTSEGYILNDRTRSDSRQITFTKLPNTLENHLHLLTKQMLFAATEVKAAGWTANIVQKQNSKSSFKRKQPLKIPLFFGRKSRTSIISQQAPVISNMENEIEIRTEYRQGFRSSLRCMIIPSYLEEAVCRECLAMHSEALTIRTYL